VEGLTVPPEGVGFEAAMGFEALQLFAQRAKRARLNFALGAADLPFVRRICEIVGGSPLGIELAAAWVKLMPVDEITAEIERDLGFLEATDRDVLERHYSVRAVFEQTWARLTPAEQRVFSKLSVFQGGFAREAAGAVAGASATTLAGLVNKSLVRVADHGRYGVHALLGQFALERLAQNPKEQEQAMTAHRAHFLELSKRFSEAIRHWSDEKRWRARIDQDLENVRTALAGWLESGESETALRCILALRNYWPTTGRTREARRWIADALARDGEVGLKLREWALAVDGEMALYMNDLTAARRRLEASLAQSETRGYAAPLTLLHLGDTFQSLGDLESAQRYYEQALAAFRMKENLPGIAAALNNIGVVLIVRGNFEGALETLKQALHAKREAGGDVELVLINIGDLCLRLGDLETANGHFLSALRGLHGRGVYNHIPEALESLGFVASSQGFWHRAAVLLGASEAQREALNIAKTDLERASFDASLRAVRETLGEHAFAAGWAEGVALTLEEAVVYATDGAG
jgi:tetratricopeptide (TPR) repeat protein